MNLFLVGIVVLVSVLEALAQDDGKYRPPATTSTARPTTRYQTYRPFDQSSRYRNYGRYYGQNAGRYVGGNDGRYVGGNDGRYYGGNDGRYVHVDNRYKHTGDGDRGQYVHVAGRSGVDAPSAGSSIVPEAPVTQPPTPAFVPTTAIPILAKQAQVRTAPRPVPGDGWKIIRLENQVRGDGYNYVFETENGINAEESGRIEPDGQGSEGLRSQGFYEYVGDDGQLYRVDYVADSNGFVPQGDHIPKVPPAIEKLLQYLASQPK
ncbi:larval cuticle protein LCP-30-like [Uranotaenia lowii]|uniref:larval cuticle protein LCP-30-like n=1 Tax=Uranotaenia lowii TaxID=190385 RepID=UPI00247A2E32|nr:larval cuticle protein LCP-30-like [Uranotaenia lowii]